MKTKVALTALVLAIAFSGSQLIRHHTDGSPPPANAGEAETLNAASAPPPPLDFGEAEAKLKGSGELLRKQMIPLLTKMPEELKKAEETIRMNDELLRKLAEMKSAVTKRR